MSDIDKTKTNPVCDTDRTEEMVGTLEVCIDEDYVSVPLDRYDELVRAEAVLDVIVAVFRVNGTYCLDNIIKAAFPEDKGDGDA